jgi:hypothetical protein
MIATTVCRAGRANFLPSVVSSQAHAQGTKSSVTWTESVMFTDRDEQNTAPRRRAKSFDQVSGRASIVRPPSRVGVLAVGTVVEPELLVLGCRAFATRFDSVSRGPEPADGAMIQPGQGVAGRGLEAS